MPISAKHPETLTVHRVIPSTETDDDGVPIVVEADLVIEGVSVEPLSAGGESATLDDGTTPDVYRVSTSEPADWVTENDSCTWGGTTYVVNNRPRTWRRYLPHTEFTIIEVRG